MAREEDVKIPDVDLLDQMHEGTTVRLVPNDEESATAR